MKTNRLKPITPTTTQIERIKKQPLYSGFMILNAGHDQIEIVEFSTALDGTLTRPDGRPVSFVSPDGSQTLYCLKAAPAGEARAVKEMSE